MIMIDRDYIIILYDYYCDLFNDKQKIYFEEYYFNNLSLSEISDNYHISRNAVSKALHNVIYKLYNYEDKLHIYSKSLKIRELVNDIDSNVKDKIINILEE